MSQSAIFFKNTMNIRADRRKQRKKIFVSGTAFIAVFWTFVFSASQVIDRIAAVVEDEVITLTDVKINRAFGVFDTRGVPDDKADLFILNRMIDQEMIIKLMGSDVTIPAKELENAVRLAAGKLGEEQARQKFSEFGIGWEELKNWFRKKLLYHHIIFDKFSRSTFVSLKEIEAYYNQTYIPSQEILGQKPKPMLSIIGEIETAIKEKKIESQVNDWVVKMRGKSNIRILMENKKDGT